MSSRSGQATSEWAILVSVLVVAVVAAGWAFQEYWEEPMEDMAENAETVYASGDLAPR
jgi:hypothetical protein